VEKFDVIVIGGGAGGLAAARAAKRFGCRVALVEKNQLGGECTWTGCVPTKSLMRIAQVAHEAKEFSCYGLRAQQRITWDASGVFNHIKQVIQKTAQTHTPEALRAEGIEVFFGSPRFIDRSSIALGHSALSAKRFILATGSRPAIPPIRGIDEVPYLTNRTFFEQDTLPSSVIILGGGPIGCEFAPMLSKLGVKVTLVEANQRLLNNDDPELVGLLTERFTSLGIAVHAGLKISQVAQNGEQVVLTGATATGESRTLTADKLLIAAGRKPNLEGLGLEAAGVKTTPTGVVADKYLCTSVDTIYACGDIVGPYLYSHVAWRQAEVAVRNATHSWWRTKVNYDDVLWITFADEELVRVGMLEDEARKKYGKIEVIRIPYSSIDRGRMDCATYGLGKFITKRDGTIVGASIIGPRAGELIHEIQMARVAGLKLYELARVMHAYPAYNDLLLKAAREAYRLRLEQSSWARWRHRWFGSF